MTGRSRHRDFDGEDITTKSQALALSATGATSAPMVNDVADGKTLVKVEPIGDVSSPAGWRVFLGEDSRE